MNIKVVKTHKDAVIPSRVNDTDIGLDLVAIDKYKENIGNSTCNLYKTGIKVCPPQGYYLEIIPRSSISKSGWMLANSIGIIDPEYNGELLIPLIRINDKAPEPELPFRLCQLVLRKAYYPIPKQVNTLDETIRGDGCFGSTG